MTAASHTATAAGTGELCGPGWQRISTPTVRQNSFLTDIDGYTGDLWGVGAHRRNRGSDASLAIHWNGRSWVETDTFDVGTATRLEGVTALASDDVWAVGSSFLSGDRFLAEHWDGSSWSSTLVPDPAGKGERLLAVDGTSPDDVWAVGSRGLNSAATSILHWDGDAWSVVPSPSPLAGYNILYAVDAVSPTQAWAFGITGSGDGSDGSTPLVLRWNGTAWSVVPEANDVPDNASLHDGSATPDGDIWTAGGIPSTIGSGEQALVQHRQGATWTTWSLFQTRWASVAPLSDADVWLAGDAPATQHWDGAGWTQLAVPGARGTFASLTLSALEALASDEVWVVGSTRVQSGDTYVTTPLAMRICPLDVTNAGISKDSSRVSQGSGTLWRFPASNGQPHDVTDALGLGLSRAPLFGTGARSPGTTGTFDLDSAGTFPVVDTTTGHTSELTVPTEALPSKGRLGTTFTVYSSARSLTSYLGSDIRYRKPGSEIWYRLVTGTSNAGTPFTPDQTGVYTFQSRLRNKTTGVVSGWSSFATIKVTVP